MNIFDDRIQITPSDKDKTNQVNEYLLSNPTKVLRLYWFEESRDFTFLKKIKNVKNLSIDYSKLTDLNFLDYFPDLESLNICEVKGAADIAALKNQNALKYLSLNLRGITQQNDLSNLHGLKNLEELSFAGKFKKKSLSLTNLKNLETLSPQIKDIDLNEAQQLPNLKSFFLIKQKIDSLNGIENLQSLRTILLNEINIDDQNVLSNIFDIEKLESLSISYVKAITDFSFITKLSNLKNLYLWSLNGLKSLNGLEKLIALKKYSQCGDHKNKNTIDFSLLKQLKTLEDIEVKVGTMNAEAKLKLEAVLTTVKK